MLKGLVHGKRDAAQVIGEFVEAIHGELLRTFTKQPSAIGALVLDGDYACQWELLLQPFLLGLRILSFGIK
jgi:hypothetical protein